MTAAPSSIPDKNESTPLSEANAWEPIDGVWKPIFGSFAEMGVSIEWHEFSNAEPLDWAESFHMGSLEICMNFSGIGSLKAGKNAQLVTPEKIAFYTTTDQRPVARRQSGHIHRFFTIELSAEFLRKEFAGVMDSLLADIQRFIDKPEKGKPVINVVPFAPGLLTQRMQLLEPPVNPSAHSVWYGSKITEILSHLLFRAEEPGEFFCHKHIRLNRDRCERVLFLLERDLENPPSLDMLAKEVQCSSFYLSRLFAQETGMSIPKYLRMKRIEKAAEFLKSGKMNVTEAAMAVGYSSLSAFNKAFVEQIGSCPGLYPILKGPLIPRREKY